jgi:hypothetical protein
MELVYNPSGLSGITTARLGMAGMLQMVSVDPHSFTGVYVSVENDTVAYGAGTWVHTHDAWVL